MSDWDGWKRGPEITCAERDAILRLPLEDGFAYRPDVQPYASCTNAEPGGLSTMDWGLRGEETPLIAEEIRSPDRNGSTGHCRHWRFVPAIDAVRHTTDQETQPMTEHWIVEALDRARPNDAGILGEGDDGRLYVPSRTRADWWDRRFNPRNPAHWRYWVKSRLTRKVAFLDIESW